MKHLSVFLASVAIATIVACGGGSGSSPPPVTITGTAATGTPMADASVYIKDSRGQEPIGQNEAAGVAVVITDANGNFSIPPSLLTGLVPPYIVRITDKVVLDSGEDAVVSLHSLIAGSGSNSVNITPLTEAATILATGSDTNQSFASPSTALAQVTSTSMAASNQSLMTAIGGAASSELNVFSSGLDARQVVDLSNPTTAKAHDLLLDSMAMSYSQGQLVLADRNRPTESIDSAPRVVVAPGLTPTSSGGALLGAPSEGFLSEEQLTQFIQRVNQQFAAGCTIPLTGTYRETCSGVLSPASNVFSAQFKSLGISSINWLKQWVANPLDTENLTDITVSVTAPYRGSYIIPGTTTRVTRVILRFQNSTGDSVRRPLLLTQSGSNVVAYGDQQDYFVWVRPRVTIAADNDNTYPYYPKYEAGLNLIVKNHYAGIPNIVMGAHISGPGLPTSRSAEREAFPGEIQNRNGITEGVELFDKTATGCSNLSIDPSVYVSKNSMSWSQAWANYKNAGYSDDARRILYSGIIRWRSTSTTCAPMFDFKRYYLNGESYRLPQKSDAYTVVLYLDKTAFDASGLTLPSGAQLGTVKNSDDDVVNIYKLTVNQVKLPGDALDIPSTLPENALPGVTEGTRQALLTADIGTDRTVGWTRNRIYWPEGTGADGQPIKTTFINFSVGVYQSAYDQYRTIDSYSSNYGGNYKNYRDFLNGADIRSRCGQTLAEYKGSDVVVYIQKKIRTSTLEPWPTTAITTTCPSDLAETTTYNTTSRLYQVTSGLVGYSVFVARNRFSHAFDRSTLVSENQTSRTLSWSYLLNKESTGGKALCSSFAGYHRYRKAYVNMMDINGRMVSESRSVSSDYPDMTSSLLGDSTDPSSPEYLRAVEVSRPAMNTDPLYLPFTINTTGYESVSNFNIGKKGIVQAAKARSGNTCSPVVW